jgi:hypothetical protein
MSPAAARRGDSANSGLILEALIVAVETAVPRAGSTARLRTRLQRCSLDDRVDRSNARTSADVPAATGGVAHDL